MGKLKEIKVIAFDADDTLWANESYFRIAEERFCELMSDFLPPKETQERLYQIEMQNMEHYGYGAKAFTLSLIEAALSFSKGGVSTETITEILDIGRGIINHPIELLNGVEELLLKLKGNFRLIVITKGDLLEQESKLIKSGLVSYFEHIEILSNKTEANYKKLLDYLAIKPAEFMMVGNSLRSDILPVVNIRAKAVYVPFHTTWQHEVVEIEPLSGFHEIEQISQLVQLLDV